MKLAKSILIFSFVFILASPVWSDSVLILSDEWPQMEVLGKFLQDQGGYQVKKVEQKEFPADISSHKAAIMFIHGSLNTEVGKPLVEFAKQGGRLIVLHHGISKGKHNTPGWMPFLGMLLDRSDKAKYYYNWIHDSDYSFVNLNPGHYITSHNVTYDKKVRYESSDGPSAEGEFPAIEFKGSEVFLNHQFTDGRQKTVLFGFKYKNPKTGEMIMQDRAGWYKPAEKGWAFYFQPGHLVEDFQNRSYCQIILNAMTWKP